MNGSVGKTFFKKKIIYFPLQIDIFVGNNDQCNRFQNSVYLPYFVFSLVFIPMRKMKIQFTPTAFTLLQKTKRRKFLPIGVAFANNRLLKEK